jgi:putative membrane protein insertion efficiency factor
MKRLLLYCIGWYQRWLSPMQRVPHCRFIPSCSEYAREAVEVHGALRGGLYAFWRLLRCQPLCKGGLDPVKLPQGTTR